MIKRFFGDIKKYRHYIWYSSKAQLKSEVAGSHLGWLWWFLDPFFFMLVYTFIGLVVIDRNMQYFPCFVFIGLQSWNYFSKTLNSSIKAVRKNKSIIKKIYLPKEMLVVILQMTNFIKMAISYLIIVALMIVMRVPVDWHLLYAIPLMLELTLFTFGLSSIFMHFGVYVEDMSNIVAVILRLAFYLTGIFYDIMTKVPEPYCNIMALGNPIAYMIIELRNCIIYKGTPDPLFYFIWLGVSVLLCIIGVNLVYRNENNYAKSI